LAVMMSGRRDGRSNHVGALLRAGIDARRLADALESGPGPAGRTGRPVRRGPVDDARERAGSAPGAGPGWPGAADRLRLAALRPGLGPVLGADGPPCAAHQHRRAASGPGPAPP